MRHTQRIRFAVRAAVILAASAGLTACDVMVNTVHGGRAQAQQTWSRTYALTGAETAVEVVNVNGTVDVQAVDGNSLEITAVLSARGATEEEAKQVLAKVEMAEQTDASHVRVQAKYPRELGRHGIEVNYTVRAPRTAKIALETVNGQLKLSGAFAGVKAETTNGSVHGDGLGGGLVATTTNGEIKVRMASLGTDGVSLETTNGTIDLRLPSDAKATLSARCVNGGIRVSDIPFEKSGEGSRRKLDGTINGGGAALRLETVNGSIRVGGAT